MITGLLVTLRIGLVGITDTDMTLGTILSSKNNLYKNLRNNLTSECHFIYTLDSSNSSSFTLRSSQFASSSRTYTEPVSEPVTFEMMMK